MCLNIVLDIGVLAIEVQLEITACEKRFDLFVGNSCKWIHVQEKEKVLSFFKQYTRFTLNLVTLTQSRVYE